jgi:hypothetical protein
VLSECVAFALCSSDCDEKAAACACARDAAGCHSDFDACSGETTDPVEGCN